MNEVSFITIFAFELLWIIVNVDKKWARVRFLNCHISEKYKKEMCKSVNKNRNIKDTPWTLLLLQVLRLIDLVRLIGSWFTNTIDILHAPA